MIMSDSNTWYIEAYLANTLNPQNIDGLYNQTYESLKNIARKDILSDLNFENKSTKEKVELLTQKIIDIFPVSFYTMSPVFTQVAIMQDSNISNRGTLSCRGLTALTSACLEMLGIQHEVWVTFTQDVIHPRLRVAAPDGSADIYIDYVNADFYTNNNRVQSALKPRVEESISRNYVWLNFTGLDRFIALDAIQNLLSMTKLINMPANFLNSDGVNLKVASFQFSYDWLKAKGYNVSGYNNLLDSLILIAQFSQKEEGDSDEQ